MNSPSSVSKALDLSARAGATIRALREHHGMTQEKLAERSGLTAAALGKIERGERLINIDTLGALARALDFEETSELIKVVEVSADIEARRAYFDEIANSLDELLDDVREPVLDPDIESDSGESPSSRGEERRESRVFTRVPFHHRVRLAGKNASCEATLFEVSRNGLSIWMPVYFRPGSTVRTIFEDITYGGTPVEFDVKVAWCEAQGDLSTTEFRAGLSTLHDDPETLAGMSEIFYTAMTRLAARSREITAA